MGDVDSYSTHRDNRITSFVEKTMDFVALLVVGVVAFVLGFAARKYFTKKDPAAVAAADAAAKKAGDRFGL